MDSIANYGSSSENDTSSDEEEVQPMKKIKIERNEDKSKFRSLFKLSDIKQRIANLEAEEAELIEDVNMGRMSKTKTNAKTLLERLPEPCNTSKVVETKSSLNFVPRKIKKEKEIKVVEPIIEVDEEEAEDMNDVNIDIFGMSGPIDVPYEEIDTKPIYEIYYDNNIPGPSRPMPTILENDIEVEEEEQNNTGEGCISKERANDLIYKYELAQWGISREAASRMATNIKDVNVDAAIGPNVESTIRANMNYGNAALTLNTNKANNKDGKTNKLAKQKHQITYLADLAVKNEDHLKEQWGNNKSKRRLAAQRYGFK
uniref:Proline-rich protein PRCC n=1 Tax=Parastrongyloides trichosuri TaxID=131310 RepID=A0A0N4Z1S5_PARTI